MRPRDEQHPTRVVDGATIWMAHCNRCGIYVDDLTYDPGVDYLCETCFLEPEEGSDA